MLKNTFFKFDGYFYTNHVVFIKSAPCYHIQIIRQNFLVLVMDYPRITLLLWFILAHALPSNAQELAAYDRFQLDEGELYWQNSYEYPGDADSVRQSVEQMLKSRAFTFNVIRSKDAYSGKINHYHVNPKRYGRTYSNTPKMYWDGEWSGKFMVEVRDGQYSVTVYALQYKSKTQSVGHYKPEKIRTGQYIDAVTVNYKQSFLKSEFLNLSLMSLSLKGSFDIKNTMDLQDDQ